MQGCHTGGGGVKLEKKLRQKQKKPKINSVGSQHTRVDNKTNKAQASGVKL